MENTEESIEQLATREYKYGWETEIEMDYAPKGVNPDIVLVGDPDYSVGSAAPLPNTGVDQRTRVQVHEESALFVC